MVRNHIKRIAAPKSWPIKRKSTKWIIRPCAGPHKIENSLPLGVLIKEILGYSKNTKETKYILNEGKVLVNGKVRKNQKLPVGLLDVLTIQDDNYRIIINQKGKIVPINIPSTDSKLLLKKVIGKKSLKGNKNQINFSDGTNVIAKDNYSSGDTIVFSEGKAKDHLKFEKGSMIYITGGKQVGQLGVVKEILNKKEMQSPKIFFTQGKEDFETLKKYAFVIGKNKPIIKLSNE